MKMDSKEIGVDEANELAEGNPPPLQIMSRPMSSILDQSQKSSGLCLSLQTKYTALSIMICLFCNERTFL